MLRSGGRVSAVVFGAVVGCGDPVDHNIYVDYPLGYLDGEDAGEEPDETLDTGDTGDGPDGGGDTAEADDAGTGLVVEAVKNAVIGSLYTLEWTSDEPLVAVGRARLPDGRLLETPAAGEAARSGSLLLRGLPALTDVSLWLAFETPDGARGRSKEFRVRTGGPPSSMPVFTVVDGPSDREPAPGWVMSTSISDLGSTGREASVFVANEQGELVWWWALGGAQDDTVARLSHDGEWVIYIADGRLQRVRFDGSEHQVLISNFEVGVHHHFMELPDGTLAVLGSEDIVLPDGTEAMTHTLVERAPSGELRQIWSLAQDADALVQTEAHTSGTGKPVLGNVNHVLFDPAHDAYLLGLQSEGVMLSVDRQTGELRWWLRPRDTADGLPFKGVSPWKATHGTEFTPDGLVVFVNSTVDSACARVELVRLDEAGAELDWVYTGDSCHTAPVLGDVHVISEDLIAVTWSASAELEQVDLSGESVRTLRASFGQIFGYGDFYVDLYQGR